MDTFDVLSNSKDLSQHAGGACSVNQRATLGTLFQTKAVDASTDETKVSYYRMKSDYYRFLAEFATGETKSKADEDALDACVEANQIAEKDLVVNHPVRSATALDFSAFRSEVFQNSDEASQMARVAFEDATTNLVIDIPAVTQQIASDQIVQKTIEIPQLRCIGNVIDIPVVEVVQVPQAHVAEKTVEITQLDVVEKIVETPKIKTGHGIPAADSGTDR